MRKRSEKNLKIMIVEDDEMMRIIWPFIVITYRRGDITLLLAIQKEIILIRILKHTRQTST
ncbi:MAG: hypothetical protein QOK91_08910 [Nitrososphaeraceae archaeon]|nr:hypothetical protein [Nitrososphaeraceae archaeon]